MLNQIAIDRVTTRPDILDLIESVRPLELYLPVDEHRAAWTGGDLLVAGQIEEEESPFVYDMSGAPADMDVDDLLASRQPVLALVPVETDFSEVLDPTLYENIEDRAGASIGTWSSRAGARFDDGSGLSSTVLMNECPPTAIIECDDEPSGGGTGFYWGDVPTGLYVTHLYIPDDHEGLKGDPEFEVHLQAPTDDPSKAVDIRCAGAKAPNPFSRFDMNGTTWDSFRKPFLVADSVEMSRFTKAYGSDFGMGVVVWEDDDTSCEIKVENDRLKKAAEKVLAVAAAEAGIIQLVDSLTIKDTAVQLPIIGTAIYALASFLKSNDDLVGISYVPTSPNPDCQIGGRTGRTLTTESLEDKGCIRLKAHDRAMY